MKASVRVITYNQAEYVGRALDGALEQRVDFPWEIVAGDDGSTDGTPEILLDSPPRSGSAGARPATCAPSPAARAP